MSDGGSQIDVNGEIDLNLNVTGKGGGQIAVIVIGVLVAVICIMLILYFSCRYVDIFLWKAYSFIEMGANVATIFAAREDVITINRKQSRKKLMSTG